MTDQISILIVDDNVGLCKTMALILEYKGYAVAIATDGPQAIERVQEKPFDLIFLDIKMTPMDGVETHRRIRGILPEVTVIMMTAYAVEDLVQQTLQQGAYSIIHKPLDIEKIIALIEKTKGRPGASTNPST
jgi:two-component system response regulator HydG